MNEETRRQIEMNLECLKGLRRDGTGNKWHAVLTAIIALLDYALLADSEPAKEVYRIGDVIRREDGRLFLLAMPSSGSGEVVAHAVDGRGVTGLLFQVKGQTEPYCVTLWDNWTRVYTAEQFQKLLAKGVEEVGGA